LEARVPAALRRLLLVSHEATRSGAPMMVLHFARWLRANTDLDVTVLLLDGGPLTGEFEAVATTRVLATSDGPMRLSDVARRLVTRRRPDPGAAIAAQVADLTGFDAVHANSVGSLEVLPYLPPARAVVGHIHELAFNLTYGVSAAAGRGIPHIDRYVVASEAVRSALGKVWAVDPSLVDVCYEFIPTGSVTAATSAADVRASLGVPDGVPFIGGAGTVEWRKGTDLFVQLAAAVNRLRGDRSARFAWLGGVMKWEPDTPVVIADDLVRAGLAEQVTMLGSRPNPADYLAAFDVLAMTSREDAFPLVCLEAAALGTPTVTFSGAGGMDEFVVPETGRRVPYLDVDAMAAAVLEIAEDPALRERLGTAARERVRAMSDVSVGAPRLLELMERAVALSPR
jgi:glycosyltransferase involved in cell wall biosynthesis